MAASDTRPHHGRSALAALAEVRQSALADVRFPTFGNQGLTDEEKSVAPEPEPEPELEPEPETETEPELAVGDMMARLRRLSELEEAERAERAGPGGHGGAAPRPEGPRDEPQLGTGGYEVDLMNRVARLSDAEAAAVRRRAWARATRGHVLTLVILHHVLTRVTCEQESGYADALSPERAGGAAAAVPVRRGARGCATLGTLSQICQAINIR
jgi:hypothetical protein